MDTTAYLKEKQEKHSDDLINKNWLIVKEEIVSGEELRGHEGVHCALREDSRLGCGEVRLK